MEVLLLGLVEVVVGLESAEVAVLVEEEEQAVVTVAMVVMVVAVLEVSCDTVRDILIYFTITTPSIHEELVIAVVVILQSNQLHDLFSLVKLPERTKPTTLLAPAHKLFVHMR